MKVVSSARKLRFRPAAGAPVVAFPEGANISNYGVNNNTPTIVVCNGTENPPSWQGVDHESGVVLVNLVPEDIANEALDIFAEDETIESLNDALNFLVEQGCKDQYTSPNEFQPKLSPAGRMLDEWNGIVKRDDRDLIEIWRTGDDIYVTHEKQPKLMHPDILLQTYRNVDGSQIDLASIPENS